MLVKDLVNFTFTTEVGFSSKSGMLYAQKEEDGSITLDFPSRPPGRVDMPEQILKAFIRKLIPRKIRSQVPHTLH